MLGDAAARCQLSEALAACRCAIRLPAGWDDFFDKSGPAAGAYDEQRQYPRVNCRGHAALRYRQTIPALPRPAVWHKVYTKDVSRCGMGFLHSEPLYPRERMTIILPDASCRTIEVVRCRRLGAACYEVGALYVAETKQGGAPPSPAAATAG